MVTGLNRHFAKATGVSQFFTMIYGILDRDTAEFRYASAGHFSPVHFRCGIAQPIQDEGGIPVGLFPGRPSNTASRYPSEPRCTSVRIGILEAENPADEQFGVDRVLEILTRNRDLRLEEAVSSLMQCVGRGPRLAVRRTTPRCWRSSVPHRQAMPSFVKSVLVDAPVKDVFRFHDRPDAFPLLAPAFPPVRISGRTGTGIEGGNACGTSGRLVALGRAAHGL